MNGDSSNRTPDQMTFTAAVNDVLEERRRQITVEGWRIEHDDEHIRGELARAAACYAFVGALPDEHSRDIHASALWGTAEGIVSVVGEIWPETWDAHWFKPRNRRRDLVRAAALLLAEIERLDRAEAKR